MLGNPQEDRELGCFNPESACSALPGYAGYTFRYPETIFLREISTNIAGVDGTFIDARWRNLDIV